MKRLTIGLGVLLACCLVGMGALLIFRTISELVAAQALIGKQVVVIRNRAELEHEGKTVGVVRSGAIFIVDDVQGTKLWIRSQNAYLRYSDVVPFDEAIDYFTRALERDRTAVHLWSRAQIWFLKGQHDLALADMDEAIHLDPNQSIWFTDRGILWMGLRRHDEALADLSEAIRLDPTNISAYNNRAIVWRSKKEYDKALSDYNEVLRRVDPSMTTGSASSSLTANRDSLPMLNTRMLTLSNRGNIWQDKGDSDKAIADYTEAIQIDSRSASVFNNRGIAWSFKGDFKQAIADYDVAIRLDPQFSSAYANRARAWFSQGDVLKGRADFDEAIKLHPASAIYYNDLAWQLATCRHDACRDGKEAVEHATTACELSDWRIPEPLDTLAAAYAEAGDFKQALKFQQQAIELAPETKKAGYESRLKLYHEQKPYRDTPKN